ncbi:TPA_asm: phosphoprotein [birds-foot trefoil-associated virus]|uniref:Phosphoprotein n=1 Tax=birds-foot trefoil-associated virus TaxID=3121202 RepID=A0A9Y0T7A4_9RHAB|nr:TPA_asm: phosphoprotein [Bird's-foot trefoil nucleorhabdovirus]
MEAVHPRYASLKDSIQDSEVLASQYANEAIKSNEVNDKDLLADTMTEWGKLFLKEGLSVNIKNIEVFSEVTMLCYSAEKQDLAGRLAISIVDAMQQLSKQYMSSSLVIDRLEGISEKLFNGVDRLERVNDTIVKALPRRKISAVRKKSEPAVLQMEQPNNGGTATTKEPLAPGKYMISLDTAGTPLRLNTIVPEEQTGETDPKIQDEAMEETQDPDQETIIDPMSDHAKSLRADYRTFYGDPSFSVLAHEKQVGLLEYYMNYILGISMDDLAEDVTRYHMLTDIVDKNRLMTVCKDAKEGSLTAPKIRAAIEEVVLAINSCGPAYGNYKAMLVTEGDNLKLYIS